MRRHFGLRPRLIQKKKALENKNNTHLYIFKLNDNIYKIGCSDDVEQRLKQGKTWSSRISMVAKRKIPASKSCDWRNYERKVHKKFGDFQCKEGGKELFEFGPDEACKAAKFMKHMRF